MPHFVGSPVYDSDETRWEGEGPTPPNQRVLLALRQARSSSTASPASTAASHEQCLSPAGTSLSGRTMFSSTASPASTPRTTSSHATLISEAGDAASLSSQAAINWEDWTEMAALTPGDCSLEF